MAKERDIEILEYKIADLEKKIAEFVSHGISELKTNKLRALKTKYETQLAALQT
jgi:hypothetical protein